MDDTELPGGLSAHGEELFLAIANDNELDPAGQTLLVEACRIVDRLEQLHWILRGDDNRWIELAEEAQEMYNTTRVEIVINNALMEARQQQLALRQLLTTLGLGRATPRASAEESWETRLDKAMHPEKYADGAA
jgi:hypothetical protein